VSTWLQICRSLYVIAKPSLLPRLVVFQRHVSQTPLIPLGLISNCQCHRNVRGRPYAEIPRSSTAGKFHELTLVSCVGNIKVSGKRKGTSPRRMLVSCAGTVKPRRSHRRAIQPAQGPPPPDASKWLDADRPADNSFAQAFPTRRPLARQQFPSMSSVAIASYPFLTSSKRQHSSKRSDEATARVSDTRESLLIHHVL
jgi:hypothetical protein